MLMYALLEFYNTGSVDITAICVNNQIESSQITWSATQQGNSKNVERQHLFRQHLCRWVFKANCASFLRWFLQTLSLACRHIWSILNFLSLYTAFLVTNFFFQIQPPSLTQTYENQGPMPHGCKRNGKCFKQGPWLAWCARESVVALALSWDIGQQGYAAHLVGGNGSYRREKAGK